MMKFVSGKVFYKTNCLVVVTLSVGKNSHAPFARILSESAFLAVV